MVAEEKRERKIVVMNSYKASQNQLDQYANRVAEILYQFTQKEKEEER